MKRSNVRILYLKSKTDTKLTLTSCNVTTVYLLRKTKKDHYANSEATKSTTAVDPRHLKVKE